MAFIGLRDEKARPVMDARFDPIGFIYVVIYGEWAYYFSGASIEPNVMHALQWRMIQQLKALGVETYELGWQGEATDEKGQGIEMFRRGFGGVDVPVRDEETT
mgnify:FL=1